jgi:replication factor C large subunit
MVSGPSGTGKSAAVKLVAEASNWNIVEMNASDYRNKESIDRLLVAASQARTIFGKRNLILLDEIDELSGRFDKGAGAAISSMLKSSKSPIIFVANNRWAQSISFLRAAVENIEFKRLANDTVAKILDNFAKKNKIHTSKETIESIAKMSNGDARSAINDIIALDNAGKDCVEVIGMRDRKTDIFQTLDKIFLSNTYAAPLAAPANSDVDNDMLIKWIDENMPKRYSNKEDLANGFKMLSLASIYATRASRSQYYTYWRYMNACLSSGVALAKESYPDKTRRYSFPRTISSLSQSKERRGTRAVIAKKLRKRIHLNTSRIMKVEMPMLAAMAKELVKGGKGDDAYDFFSAKFGMDSKEVDWLVENIAE